MSILDSFFVALGFEIDDSNAEVYAGALSSLRQSALALTGVFVGAAAAVGGLAISAAESLGEIQKFAEINEVSAAMVHGLSIAGKEYDLTLQGVESTVARLNISIGQAALHLGRGGQAFKRLGIDVHDANGKVKDTTEVLADVADKMQDMSAGERLALASRLGIDEHFIGILKQGRDAFEDWAESAKSPFTDAQFQQADRIDKLWKRSQATFKSLWTVIGVSLFPAVEDLLRSFLAWWKAAKPEIVERLTKAFGVLATVVSTVGKWLFGLFQWGYKIVEWLSKFKIVTDALLVVFTSIVALKISAIFFALTGAIYSAVVAMASFDAAALLIPIAIGLLIAAVGLVAYELYAFFTGQDSILTRWAKKWPWVGQFVKALGADFVWLGQRAMQIWDTYLSPFLTWLGQGFVTLWEGYVKPLVGAWYELFTQTIGPIWGVVSTFLGAVYDLWSYTFAAVWEELSKFFRLFTGGTEDGSTSANTFAEVIKVVFGVVTEMIKGAALVLTAFIDDLKWAVDKARELAGLPSIDEMEGQAKARATNAKLANREIQTVKNSGWTGNSGPSPAGVSPTTTNGWTTVHDNSNTTIHIDGSKDPKATGDEVSKTLRDRTRHLIRNGQTGVVQ